MTGIRRGAYPAAGTDRRVVRLWNGRRRLCFGNRQMRAAGEAEAHAEREFSKENQQKALALDQPPRKTGSRRSTDIPPRLPQRLTACHGCLPDTLNGLGRGARLLRNLPGHCVDTRHGYRQTAVQPHSGLLEVGGLSPRVSPVRISSHCTSSVFPRLAGSIVLHPRHFALE